MEDVVKAIKKVEDEIASVEKEIKELRDKAGDDGRNLTPSQRTKREEALRKEKLLLLEKGTGMLDYLGR